MEPSTFSKRQLKENQKSEYTGPDVPKMAIFRAGEEDSHYFDVSNDPVIPSDLSKSGLGVKHKTTKPFNIFGTNNEGDSRVDKT